MMNSRYSKRTLNGVLLLDKPVGISSNSALQQARHLFRAQKAGHTGVLDPLASGLLPVCFGEATKFAQYLLDADKAYTATLQLGVATTTGDAEGEVIACACSDISLTEFQAACSALTGNIRQIPPMFSALKHEGKPLYEYARRGIVIERKARDIVIHHIDIQKFAPPIAVIDVCCSKGTYIRTLSEDIAKHIGTLAHLTALRRTKTAGFEVSQAHTLNKLSVLPENERDALLLPCDALLSHLPRLALTSDAVRRLRFGQTVAMSHDMLPENIPLRLYTETNEFIGLVKYQGKSKIINVLRLMNTENTAQEKS